jgi:large subunit ribosomal protein L6
MSRIGRLPIALPDGVTVHVHDGTVRVEGPKGKLARSLPADVTVNTEGRTLTLARRDDSRTARANHGLARKLVSNMVDGVGKGFTRTLEITGVGYRAEVRGNAIFFTLGYSHPILYQLPPGITAKVDRMVVVTLEGADREVLGETAAAIRGLRPPEPYKGKGIKFAGEHIRRKAGKAAAGASR